VSASATIRGRVAVVGIGETDYYKHGQAPESEVALALRAILRACEDAGLDPRTIDGFASYSNDRNDPSRLAAALGLPELRFSNMQWGGGGGGGSAAVGNAAAAIAAGYADCVVVFRALAQGQFQRFGAAPPAATVSGEAALTFPYGLISPAQRFAMRVMRFMHEHGIRADAQRAIALASYHHAQSNPRAVMHGRPLTPEAYDASRWIVEPFRLFDCCLENDGAAALILMSAENAARRGLKPLARIASWATAGVDPAIMGSGPIPASRKALERAGWKAEDLDLIEANEAFAAQACAVNKDLGWDTSKVNVNGGAIALGHPIGASGARVLVTLLHEMQKRNAKKGLATLCIGGGMGIALTVER